MGVKKFRPSGMLYSRLLSERADKVRRSARTTAQAAHDAVHQSENLIEQSRDALERADKMLRDSEQAREIRRAQKQAADGSPERKRVS